MSRRGRALAERRPAGGGVVGFTLIELVVALGVLMTFMMFLVQILAGGVSLFDEGERSQEVSDLRHAAASTVRDAINDFVGPTRECYEPGAPQARLLVQWIPLGLKEQQPKTLVQAIRSSVRVDALLEEALLRRSLRAQAQAEGGMDEAAIAERVDQELAQAPRRGRAAMLLLPWPAGDADGAFLELRRALLLPDEQIVVDRRQTVGLFDIEQLDDGTLRPEVVKALSEPIVTGLLHFELRLASQYTKAFELPPGESGPEWVWDSARAGWLSSSDVPGQKFSLDLGASSLNNVTDDVHPRRVQATLVVARENESALLAEDLGTTDTALRLLNPEALPEWGERPWVKIGSEWVRAASANGDRLTGVQRAQRGTPVGSHAKGTRVRIGQTIQLEVVLPHGRDCWNG